MSEAAIPGGPAACTLGGRGTVAAVEHFEIVLAALFVSVAGLNVLARRLDVPYPIPLKESRLEV